MKAIRWVSGQHNGNTGPQNKNVNALTFPEVLAWEASPDREISVEVLMETTFNLHYESIGLEVDMNQTELVRVYAEDAWTLVNSDGTLRSSCVDEEVCWGDYVDSGWENAERVYHSIDDRENWAEGVVRNPKYTAVVYREDDDTVDYENVELAAAFFNLPIVSITTDDRAVLE